MSPVTTFTWTSDSGSLAPLRDAQGRPGLVQEGVFDYFREKRAVVLAGQSYDLEKIIKPVKMAGDCTHITAHYAKAASFRPSEPWMDVDRDSPSDMESVGNSARGSSSRWSSNFDVIDGMLYRKKLERGFINYREVLDEDRRHEAIATFHRRRSGKCHLSLEETYKCVAENYWWEGMGITIIWLHRKACVSFLHNPL